MRSISAVLGVAALLLTGCASTDSSEPSSEPKQPLTGQERVEGASQEALNVWEWGQAATMLESAAALIEERGWQQGATEPVQAECITTALENAFFEGATFTVVDFNYARKALTEVVEVPMEPEALPEVPVAVPYWGQDLIAWNDEPGRTEDEVLLALRDAAQLAKQYRDEAVEGDVRLD